MKYDIAPQEIKISGKTYSLIVEEHSDQMFKGWWSYTYTEKGKGRNVLPPEVTDGKEIFYLCSMAPKKQEAEEDILKKINTVKKVLTEEDKKQQKLLEQKRLIKYFNRK